MTNGLNVLEVRREVSKKYHTNWIHTPLFVTGRKDVLAKVIFSRASVIHSVHDGGGGGLVPGGLQIFREGWSGPGGWWSGPRGVSKFSGGGGFLQFFGGTVPPIFRGVPPIFWGFLQFFGGVSKFSGGGSPPEYGQRSTGTHRTGMHSCLK